jgi:hypothetical protein
VANIANSDQTALSGKLPIKSVEWREYFHIDRHLNMTWITGLVCFGLVKIYHFYIPCNFWLFFISGIPALDNLFSYLCAIMKL